jgi:restriction system protein
MIEQVRELPKHDGLFWPVVNALKELGGSADNDQLVETVSEILGLEDDLTAIPHGNGPMTEIAYRIAWVKTWLKWGGIVDNPRRGVWVLTEKGRAANENDIAVVRKNLRSNLSRRRKGADPVETSDETQAAQTRPPELSELEDSDWQDELLNIIKDMSPASFERLARLLLLSLGFSQVENVGRSGDGGIDLMGVVKVNNVLSFRVLAQCKRYKETVGPGEVRNFRGAMQGRTDKGIIITSGRFTQEAKKEASRDGVPEIDLVDGEALTQMLRDLKMGVETQLIEKVTIDRSYFQKI